MKTVSAGETTLLQSGAFTPCDLIKVILPSGTFGFWFGGAGKVSDGGQDYVGCGNLLALKPVTTAAGNITQEYDLELSGLKAEDLALVESEDYSQRPCLRQEAYIGPDGITLSYVRTVHSGRVDILVRHDIPEAKMVVTIRGASQLVKGRGGWRRTDVAQKQLAYPINDRFFEGTSQAGRRIRYWGPNNNPQRSAGALGVSGGGGPQGETVGRARGRNS